MTVDYHHNPRPEMLQFIPPGSQIVLDVGCAAGAFGQAVRTKFGAEVWGIEPHAPAAQEAASKLSKVIHAPIETAIAELPDGRFDLIVLNDVLEHLIDPEACLRQLKAKLKPGGHFLCSVPNVRYYKHLREVLVHGEWEYRDEGVLDRTHLRFFTIKSVAAMLARLDCDIVTLKGINGRRRLWLKLLNLLSFGGLSDIPYMQIACLAKPRSI